jgi:hypothetical protein
VHGFDGLDRALALINPGGSSKDLPTCPRQDVYCSAINNVPAGANHASHWRAN